MAPAESPSPRVVLVFFSIAPSALWINHSSTRRSPLENRLRRWLRFRISSLYPGGWNAAILTAPSARASRARAGPESAPAGAGGPARKRAGPAWATPQQPSRLRGHPQNARLGLVHVLSRQGQDSSANVVAEAETPEAGGPQHQGLRSAVEANQEVRILGRNLLAPGRRATGSPTIRLRADAPHG